MKRIRTKLILSLLVITLLPVFPVYYLVKNLLQRSLEVGYNENVEMALESASTISRELYARYKEETLDLASEVASSHLAIEVYGNNSQIPDDIVKRIGILGHAKMDFFDNKGRLINSASNNPTHEFPVLYQSTVEPLSQKGEAEVLEGIGGTGYILAFAPVRVGGRRHGSIVATKRVDEDFTRKADLVVKVHQMFKTLDFFEADLTQGFLLSFFVVYAPIALISILLGIYFSRKITSPLLLLVKGTKEVAAGDWNYRMKVKSKDEVGELVAAFNHMIATLKEKQDQVIALEKMAVWREIARILAHEIKNPLTPIQLTVQQMKDKYSGEDPEYQKLLEECTEIISDEIDSLRTLVREFSEFARMPKVNLAPGNINELVAEVSKLYPKENLAVKLDSSLPEFNFDYEKMRRVLINLIENGFDSIRAKGMGDIHIETSLQNGKAVLQYSDTGKGIPEDIQDKIFEPYFSTKKSGMGLGLAIVKKIVVEHGGEISLESVAGEGTKFYIKLPIVR